MGPPAQVLEGIRAATAAGLRVKINAVALKGVNDSELFDLVQWCGDEGHDLTFIEVMPMGEMGEEDRLDQYWPLSTCVPVWPNALRCWILPNALAARPVMSGWPRPGRRSASSRP